MLDAERWVLILLGVARRTIVQPAAELTDRELWANLPHTVTLEAPPRPLVVVRGVALEVVLARRPHVEGEGDAVEFWAFKGRFLVILLAHHPEGFRRVVPDPQRVPERVADGLDVQVELGNVLQGGELAAHLTGECPLVGLHVARIGYA